MLRSKDPDERNRGFAIINAKFDQPLLRLIRTRLEKFPGILGKWMDAEDIAHSIHQRFFIQCFEKGTNFDNRNLMWGYIRRMTIRRVGKVVDYHYAQERDVRRDKSQPPLSRDQSSDAPDILECGRRYVPFKSPGDFRNESLSETLANRSDESPPGDDLLALMDLGPQQEHADVVIDLLTKLETHDLAGKDDLLGIVRFYMQGLSKQEIADELGMSTKTLKKKTDLIGDIVLEAKLISIQQAESTPVFRTVFSDDTAKDLLHRLGFDHKQYQLVKDAGSTQFFAANENLHEQLTDGDELLIRPL